MSIAEVYNAFVLKLSAIYSKEESITITNWVFEDLASSSRLNRITHPAEELDEPKATKLQAALDSLLNHTPVQYVLGATWFCDMQLEVNQNVLIPRPETEELVEWIVEDANPTPNSIIDIGTGSGCIALALKKKLPFAKLTALDISAAALEVAKRNAIKLSLEIDLLELNFLNEYEWNALPLYETIVSNPPYISLKEKNTLNRNVVDHEPHLALFIENDPMLFYKKIAEFSCSNLKKNGSIYVEIHEDLAENVCRIFKDSDFEVEQRKDFYGRDRMVKAWKS